MKYGPFLAVFFAFFLIAIFPYYTDNDEPMLITADSDGDGVTDDKDSCPNEKPLPGEDLDEDGCIDSKISKKEIDYLERISRINLAQQLIFALVAIVSGALYWERNKIRSVLYEEDEFESKFKESLENDEGSQNVDYDKLGEDKVVTEQTGSVFDGFRFSFREFNAESDQGIQIISLVCLIFLILGPTDWLYVAGETTNDEGDQNEVFEATYYSTHLETTSGDSQEYETPQCTDDILNVYNCNYRSSLFGTLEQLAALSALFCFIVLVLNFRAEKYRRSIAVFFGLCLVTTMGSLLIFTSLIDNAIESDSRLLENQGEMGECWMEEVIVWGETECLVQVDGVIYKDETNYSPGVGFWTSLITISILFVGLFTSIEPLLTRESKTWFETFRENWQVLALIFAIFFLWRLNEVMTNL